MLPEARKMSAVHWTVEVLDWGDYSGDVRWTSTRYFYQRDLFGQWAVYRKSTRTRLFTGTCASLHRVMTCAMNPRYKLAMRITARAHWYLDRIKKQWRALGLV